MIEVFVEQPRQGLLNILLGQENKFLKDRMYVSIITTCNDKLGLDNILRLKNHLKPLLRGLNSPKSKIRQKVFSVCLFVCLFVRNTNGTPHWILKGEVQSCYYYSYVCMYATFRLPPPILERRSTILLLLLLCMSCSG